jgi:hypothetical protein
MAGGGRFAVIRLLGWQERQGLKYSYAGVAGGGAAKSDDDVAASSFEGMTYELAGAVGGSVPGVALIFGE